MMKRNLKYMPDALILLLMCGFLYYGAAWQMFEPYTDAARYQCYATAFWRGLPAVRELPTRQCGFETKPSADLLSFPQSAIVHSMRQAGVPEGVVDFVAAQSPDQVAHALPHEYPLLTVISFTLGLMAPAYWYQVAFALWMLLFAVAIYLALLRWRSRRAAIACALYLVCGGWATVAGRFDIIPALLTLLAILCAVHMKWKWAFVCLALGVLFKFYPLVLLMPFLLAQQMSVKSRWYAWSRWGPLSAFVFVCVAVMLISLLLSVEGTLAPLSYFGSRPVQIESSSASFLWLLSLVGVGPLTYAFTYGSLNVFSPASVSVSYLGTLLLVAGLCYTYWLQWRTKIDLATASLLTLLIVMFTSKVFSPQYLIWVIPIAAYIGETKRWWVLSWTLLGLLTTWIYPFIYIETRSLLEVPFLQLFYPVTAVRNMVLLLYIVAMLIVASRRSLRAGTTFSNEHIQAPQSSWALPQRQ